MAGALSTPTAPPRGWRWWLVVAGVIAMHAVVTSWWSDQVTPIDPRLREAQRIKAAYTRQLAMTDAAPAPVARAPAPPPVTAGPRARAVPVAPAASVVASAASQPTADAPEPPASAPAEPTPPLPQRMDAVAVAASAPDLDAAASAALQAALAGASSPAAAAPDSQASQALALTGAAASAAANPTAAPAAPAASAPSTAFEWPASTRISYKLTGWYRGEVEGSAQVEWLREGNRYQVHVDVVIGPSFAPLGKRRMSSEGEITAAGLAPRRYEQITSQIIGSTRSLLVQLEPDQVQLSDGRRVPRPPEAQDTASQFVQLVWLFTMQPELLRVGRSIEIPLVLPRRVERFVYDVVEEERLASRFGEIPTLHVKPRRAVPLPGDLAIEMWFAPRLQNLPVRFMIRQDETNFVDLRIDRLPEQAAPEAAPPPRANPAPS